ncbi:hypothetical protein AB0F92_39795 [Kitasatospora aureofaciens]|uniref:hypothetical protein n=1 Tax=Kitasatospora aureofaciens TaxID=1894 RepID=UPI0033FE3A70
MLVAFSGALLAAAFLVLGVGARFGGGLFGVDGKDVDLPAERDRRDKHPLRSPWATAL